MAARVIIDRVSCPRCHQEHGVCPLCGGLVGGIGGARFRDRHGLYDAHRGSHHYCEPAGYSTAPLEDRLPAPEIPPPPYWSPAESDRKPEQARPASPAPERERPSLADAGMEIPE